MLTMSFLKRPSIARIWACTCDFDWNLKVCHFQTLLHWNVDYMLLNLLTTLAVMSCKCSCGKFNIIQWCSELIHFSIVWPSQLQSRFHYFAPWMQYYVGLSSAAVGNLFLSIVLYFNSIGLLQSVDRRSVSGRTGMAGESSISVLLENLTSYLANNLLRTAWAIGHQCDYKGHKAHCPKVG